MDKKWVKENERGYGGLSPMFGLCLDERKSGEVSPG